MIELIDQPIDLDSSHGPFGPGDNIPALCILHIPLDPLSGPAFSGIALTPSPIYQNFKRH